MKHIPPQFGQKAFHCPLCSVYSEQTWSTYSNSYYTTVTPSGHQTTQSYRLTDFASAKCNHCSDFEQMHVNFTLITSIKGIGKVNGLMTIAYTENFTSFTNPRSYAVYVGVIPFDHSSGTSIRGRKRVSHIANKELKQELNQAATVVLFLKRPYYAKSNISSCS